MDTGSSYDFRDAMAAAGLHTDAPIVADGVLRRFRVLGDKPGTQNGWYVLRPNGPAGAFGNWKSGMRQTWSAKSDHVMTRDEYAEFMGQIQEANAQREAERARVQQEACGRAEAEWNEAMPAQPDHPYLVRKQVRSYGIRQSGSSLLIPIRDTDGMLYSSQRISPEGEKRFLPGGAVRGHFYLIGEAPHQTLCIAEGYATGASIHEATGYPVAVAFNAGNLEPVAMALRKRFPALKLIVCADNDHATEGNPGVAKATEAARGAKAYLAIPPFDEGVTDFNDHAALRGMESVRDTMREARRPEISKLDSPPFPTRKCIRIDDFIDEDAPADRWLLKDCLPMGVVGLIVGPGGVGKSRFVCQLLISVATGGTFAAWEIGEPGSVLAFFAEDDRKELHKRFKRAFKARDLDPETKEVIRERLGVASMTRHDNLMTEKQANGEVIETGYADRLISLAKEIEDLKLIVIDPLCIFRGGDENAAIDTYRFVAVMRRISEETGATVLGIHHTNKASSNDDDPSQHASRGSSALSYGVRWVMNLSGMSRKEAKGLGVPDQERRLYVKITITKNNYAPPPKTGDVWLENHLESGLLRPAVFVAKDAKNERKIKNKMADLVWDGATRDEEYSKTDFLNKFGGITKALQVSERVSERLLEECLDEKSLILRKPIQGRRGVTEVLAVHDVDAAARRVNAEADAYRRASRGA